jgi:DHA1 family bicyclomycin/chloramphenicol resistance-like MFS transporter
MVAVALSFGLISPNAQHGALQPVPQIAGSASAVLMFIQTLAAGSSSALVALLFDGHSALSMAEVMVAFCVVAAAAYLCLVRPGERLAFVA